MTTFKRFVSSKRRILENALNRFGADVFDGKNINLSSFEIQKDLCREIWKPDDSLKPEVRDALLDIADDFIGTLELEDMSNGEIRAEDIISDIQFLGSLASFNYSKYSDIDLHILVDISGLDLDELSESLLRKYFTQCKDKWNMDHSSLKVFGFDVELYIQDSEEKNAANGIYSVENDEWVKFPSEMDSDYDRDTVRKKSLEYIHRIDYLSSALQTGEREPEEILDSAEALKDKIVKGRRESLGGPEDEMSTQNLVFKVLRRSDYIEKLNNLIFQSYDRSMSI